MKQTLIAAATLLALISPIHAQDDAAEPAPQPALSPTDIVNAAPQDDWVGITAQDILVMTLTPDAAGEPREVIIQLMPAPFSQGWVENIRTLARAKWYDGISVNRVQDNYVVQWGDPGHDNPEGQGLETKPLPGGLNVMGEEEYVLTDLNESIKDQVNSFYDHLQNREPGESNRLTHFETGQVRVSNAQYRSSLIALFEQGFPFAMISETLFQASAAPVHCYGMIGVGRNYSPDTGSGAELYTVIGHAPRHLDRNIALVGRIISGMEHLSSLPRGSGALGFYTAEEKDKRVPILSIRVASDLPEAEQPRYEYLSTESETFARYAEARANRRDPFFIVPAGGADICNIPVPIRTVSSASDLKE